MKLKPISQEDNLKSTNNKYLKKIENIQKKGK